MPVKIMPANMANTTMKSSENAIEITEIKLLWDEFEWPFVKIKPLFTTIPNKKS